MVEDNSEHWHKWLQNWRSLSFTKTSQKNPYLGTLNKIGWEMKKKTDL